MMYEIYICNCIIFLNGQWRVDIERRPVYCPSHSPPPPPTPLPQHSAPSRQSDIIHVNPRTSSMLKNTMRLLQWVVLPGRNDTSEWLICYGQLVSAVSIRHNETYGKAHQRNKSTLLGAQNYPRISLCDNVVYLVRLRWVNGVYADPITHQLPRVYFQNMWHFIAFTALGTLWCFYPHSSGTSRHIDPPEQKTALKLTVPQNGWTQSNVVIHYRCIMYHLGAIWLRS